MTTAKCLKFKKGPGTWGVILSLFEKKPVSFEFEEAGNRFNGREFVITGVIRYEGEYWIGFRTMFPYPEGEARFSTEGFLNLQTREGHISIESTPGAIVPFPEEWEREARWTDGRKAADFTEHLS